MSAFIINDVKTVAIIAALIALMITSGYLLPRVPSVQTARTLSWLQLFIGTFAVERLSAHEASGVRMIALIIVALIALKAIVCVEDQARGVPGLRFGQWVEFAAGWPGMQPRLFSAPRSGPLGGAGRLMSRGAGHFTIGGLLFGIACLVGTECNSPLLATLFLLPGLSLMLHFGFCNILAGGWRMKGVNCAALFRAPLRSESLAEFWSHRWNLAFSEMTAVAVYRPLCNRLSRGPALFAAFLFSGLLHEMAISLPVRGGFGQPFAYFALHGGLVLVERRLLERGLHLRGWLGRAWTIFWLLIPLPLLFHKPFLAGIVWPLIGIPAG